MLRLFFRGTGILAIVLFWGVMWGLLLRSELHPDDSSLRAVPLDLVARQFFDHDQASELTLRVEGKVIGHLRILPRSRPEGPQVQCFGNFLVPAPDDTPQRTTWDTELNFSPALDVTSVRGSISIRQGNTIHSPSTRTEYKWDAATNTVWYHVTSREQQLAEQTFTLDQAGLAALMAEWGLNPELARQLAPAAAVGAGPAQVDARQARFVVRGEPLETWHVALRLGGQTWLEGYVSQLGQLLQVRTLWGWTLDTE